MISVYTPEETLFDNNGIKILKPLRALIHKEDNGEYYLDLKDRIEYLEYYKSGNIIRVPTPWDKQCFRIKNLSIENNKIEARAYHLFYDSENYIISDSYVVDMNCNNALDHINTATDRPSPFQTISDVPTVHNYRCVRKSLAEAVKDILGRWGGHIVRDNRKIEIRQEIGQDRGVSLSYGKNIVSIKAEEDWNDVCTKIMPVGKDGLLLPEIWLSYREDMYDIPYTKVVSFEQNDINPEDYEDAQQKVDEAKYKEALINNLRIKGNNYLNENCVPKVNYTINEYLKNVSDVGDKIYVRHPKCKIELMTNVISLDFDVILQRITKVEFGNFKTGNLGNLIETFDGKIKEKVDKKVDDSTANLRRELTEATQVIRDKLGNSYVVFEGDKILVLDALPKEEARNVIMINSGGIGFSKDGINGTFDSAWTIDGTLDMQKINVINMVCDIIKGGNDSNGKRWWFMNDPSVSTPAAQDAVERALDEALEAFGMNSVQRDLARGMVHQQAGNIRHAAANLASNSGSNIAGIHAQEGQVANMMDLANMQRSPDAVQAHPELAAVDRLLLKYFDCIATSNGVSVNDLNDDMAELLDSPAFGNLVGETFGCFNIVEQPTFFVIPTGGATRRVVNGVDRLKILLMKRGADQRTFERERFFSKMQRNAPILVTSLILSSRMGALAHAKDILIQAGAWVKAGVIKTYNRFVYNRLTLERDPVKLKELMTEYLKSSVFRQDAAMDRIVEIMSGMTDLWKQSDESGKPCNCACTMAFIGDSGIGKTHAARTLSKAIFHKDMQPWQFITSTSVTASTSAKDAKTGEGLAPADQLFNANSEIVRQLKLNNRVVVVLDEIDKMHKADPNDTILERLRDARDTGKLLVRNGVNYEYIDVSRTVFICITNELRQCWGLPPVQLTEAQAAARTNIQRDKSLVNRFDIVEFNNLKADDYAFILKPQLDELRKEYSQKYGIDINVSEKLVKDISNAAEVRNKGVRGVNDFLILLRGKLVDYRSKHKPKVAAGKQEQRYKIGVKYSPEAGNFVLVN